MLQTGRGKSLAGGTTWQRFGNREQPQGSEVQESFLLPSKAAQVPPSCWVGRLEVEKAIEHGKGSQWPGMVMGTLGLPDQLTPSLSSGTNGSPVLAWSLSTALAVFPFPGLGDKTQRNHRRNLSIHPTAEPGAAQLSPLPGLGSP